MKKFMLFTLTAMMLAGCSFEINQVDEEQDDSILFEVIENDDED
ncbi:hypothetical protein JMA_03350 [Jeotgalibacillus malaysiensis]|uniref:Lipoprotein n=1 Tax=Jeotgalibacillus malaysiensis TaxID=1508404 RepID=A0A0B5ALT3_9BACL|nr:hypothetical protein [Jeotgalibacillus malaysiensis]AJD89652.1 hypothetical protein JMA_03350 [Jeotgalibacillus malaysiensis]